MGKYFKWSALATIVLAIIYYFVPYETKPLTIDFLSAFSLGFGKTASNFYNLLFIIPSVLLIVYANKNAKDTEGGHLVIAVATIIMSICYFDERTQKLAYILFGIMGILISFLSMFIDCTSIKQIVLRILSSIAMVFLVQTVFLGFYNGVLIAGYVFANCIFWSALAFTIAYSYKFLKNLPKIIKTFITWMNK